MSARLSLSARFLAGIAIALLPLLALLVFTSVSDFRLRRHEALEAQLATAEALASLADAMLVEALADAQSFATVPDIASLEPARAEPALRKLQAFFPTYDALALFDARGHMVAASKSETQGPVDIAGRDYFLELQRTGKPVLSDLVVSRLTGQPIVVAAAPLLDGHGSVRGALLVTIAAERMGAALIVPSLIETRTSVSLYSPANLLAFHTGFPDLTWEQRELQGFEPVERARVVGRFTGEHPSALFTEPRLGAFARSPRFGWVVGVTLSAADAFAAQRDAVKLRLAGFLAIALLSIALTKLVTRHLVRPIRELTAQTDALAAGRFEGRVPVASRDELGTLAESFNRMASQLAESHSAQQRALGELRAVLDTVDAAILVVDSSRRVRYLNRNLADWFSLDEADALGRDLRELFRERMAPLLAGPDEALQRIDEEFAQPGTLGNEPLELQGARPRSLVRTSALVVDERGAQLGRVFAFDDVTELRRTERMRDEFLSAAAHELKTPITAIKGFAQLLLRSPEQVADSGRPMLETIDRQCDRLRHLADDLLQVARLRVGRLAMSVERADLAEVGRQALERWHSREPRRPLSLEASSAVWVEADLRLLGQLLDNLIDNAVKYSPAGSPIDLRVDASGEKALVSVRDRGLGIPADKQERIFDPFFRAHTGMPEDSAGLGIGLFLSQRIAQQHGGAIEFTSAPGEGSTFTLTLPLAPAPTQPR